MVSWQEESSICNTCLMSFPPKCAVKLAHEVTTFRAHSLACGGSESIAPNSQLGRMGGQFKLGDCQFPRSFSSFFAVLPTWPPYVAYSHETTRAQSAVPVRTSPSYAKRYKTRLELEAPVTSGFSKRFRFARNSGTKKVRKLKKILRTPAGCFWGTHSLVAGVPWISCCLL